MHIARNIRVYMSVTVILLLAVLMSCNKVQYGYVDTGEADHNNPSISEVSFSFDWSKMGEKEVPEDLTVVMSRIVNTVHYVYALDKDGLIIGSAANTPELQDSTAVADTSQAPQLPETPDSLAGPVIPPFAEPSPTDTILNGDYYVMALAQANKNYAYIIEGVDQFVDSLNISMKDLYAAIPEVPEEDIVKEEIVDFNPMYPIIYPAEPLYLEVKKQSIYPQEDANNVVLTPQTLVRKMTFKINISTEEGVKIERLLGIMSGVPTKIQLMSGVVSRTGTGKVFFDMKDIFSNNNEYVFAGDANVLGLFPATKPGFITGPGILQIILDATVDGSARRRFFASINLKETIEKADLMIQTEDHLGYRCLKDAVLEIPTTLVVSRDQIVSSGGNGLEVWYDNQNIIDTEI